MNIELYTQNNIDEILIEKLENYYFKIYGDK